MWDRRMWQCQHKKIISRPLSAFQNVYFQDVKDLSESSRAIDSPDTLDSLLNFLRQTDSPVSGVMELRGILLAQKEEKIEIRSLVDQMRVEIQGIR